MKPKKKTLRVYVCSSLRPKVVKRVDKILQAMKETLKPDGRTVSFFRPGGTDKRKRDNTVRIDVMAIDACDELWVVGNYGRDCSWEIGYATALGKKIRIFEDHTNRRRLESDWMWRAGYLCTNNLVLDRFSETA